MGIIVLDIGTSSMRSVLYDDTGKKLFTRQIEYSPMYLEDDRVEQDTDDWKNAMEETLRAGTESARAMGQIIRAVAITSQRSSIIPIGEDDEPLGNAIMWQDKRVLDITKELQPYNSRIFELSGSRINPVFSGAKMTWLHRNEPEKYKKARRIVVIPDFLVHELTDIWVTDATYGSRSLLMNLKTRTWDDELLDIFEVDREKLCDIAEPGSVVGTVTLKAAERTGLPEGIPVISVGGDQQSAALGLGVLKEGTMEVSVGTGGYIIAACDGIPDDLKQDVICNASAIPGQYILESSILTCASAFNWFLKLCYDMNEANKKEVLAKVNADIEQALEGNTDVIVLPYFQGRGTPDWNSKAKGSFHNLTLGTTRGEIARALFEGLCMEVSENVKVIEQYVKKTESIFACGGLANSVCFTRMLSDICEIPVGIYEDNEATALGAWISAATAIGLYRDYQEAFDQVRRDSQVRKRLVEASKVPYYRRKRQEYVKVYSGKDYK